MAYQKVTPRSLLPDFKKGLKKDKVITQDVLIFINVITNFVFMPNCPNNFLNFILTSCGDLW